MVENDAMAYLVNMSPRLVELYRVLESTGSFPPLRPHLNHYLKLLDEVFGETLFVSEIIWKRTSAHNISKKFGPIHDVPSTTAPVNEAHMELATHQVHG